MARKPHTREFKLQSLKMLTDQGLSVAEVARRLGITEGSVRAWREAPEKHGAAFPGHGHPAPAEDELRRLRAERDLLKEPPRTSSTRRVDRPFIADHAAEWPVAWMCDALDVSESGYHAWAARAPSEGDNQLVAAIEVIHAEVKGRYGSPRMTTELSARGHACSENTVARLMREHGARATTLRRFVRTTDSRHEPPVSATSPPYPGRPWNS